MSNIENNIEQPEDILTKLSNIREKTDKLLVQLEDIEKTKIPKKYDFSWMNGELSRSNLEDMYKAIQLAEVPFCYFKNFTHEKFRTDEEVSKIMPYTKVGHSGFSAFWTMSQFAFIENDGWEKYYETMMKDNNNSE